LVNKSRLHVEKMYRFEYEYLCVFVATRMCLLPLEKSELRDFVAE